MKKILILDDKIYSDNSKTISYLDIWKKKSIGSIDFVRVENDAKVLFDYDIAGNSCKAIFDVDDYEYIFIHNSQKGDGLIPSNIIDLIKIDFGSKLILFSGAIKEAFLNEEGSFIYRSIQRKKMENNYSSFLKKSILLQEWKLEILYFDYEKFLIGKIIEMQDLEALNETILQSLEFNTLLKLKYVKIPSPMYEKILSCEGNDLIEQLRSL
ncbi:hypothetical protein [[Flexibacter] sp. ATCC 35103]|uniref:hypothetical protein n=1 Tax=[Flexibacter] sp. ATCC 35103 TaxID=1937528 RepID=UPI0009D1A4AE|nr:hypothetical protein [[Flexibacter] sp. ATCC 35103]OMQ13677.1 hypothetical protein BXU01_04170 [[Flexibacter] sp. ATCC 35103]